MAYTYLNRMTYDAGLIHPDDKTTFELSRREIGKSSIGFRTCKCNYTILIIQNDYLSMPLCISITVTLEC